MKPRPPPTTTETGGAKIGIPVVRGNYFAPKIKRNPLSKSHKYSDSHLSEENHNSDSKKTLIGNQPKGGCEIIK